jgi:transcriptional regulator with XRE-family HTH domain
MLSTLLNILYYTLKGFKLVFMSLADRIKERRLALGFKQGQLASKINRDQQVVQRLEKGLILNPRNIEVIARVLETTPEYLLFGKREDITYSINIPILDKNNLANSEIKQINLPSEYYSLVIDDDSMYSARMDEPSFQKGSLVIVDPSKKAEIENFVIIKFKDKVFLRKLVNTGKFLRFAAFFGGADWFDFEEADILGVVIASMNLDL